MTKKIILLLVGIVLSAASAPADNYFTTAYGDTVLIDPLLLNNGYTVPFEAHFDGRLDSWSLTMTYPSGLSIYRVALDSVGRLPYVDQFGNDTTLLPLFLLPNGYNIIQASITTPGYWDPDSDGVYESYGTVKWEPGFHEHMFSIRFDIDLTFRSGYITVNGLLSSTPDSRGGTIPNGVLSYSSIFVKIGYMRGDVDGNRELGIADVTKLLGYLNDPVAHPLNEFQLDAADVNGDGEIGIADVTTLISILMEGGVIESVNDIFEQA